MKKTDLAQDIWKQLIRLRHNVEDLIFGYEDGEIYLEKQRAEKIIEDIKKMEAELFNEKGSF